MELKNLWQSSRQAFNSKKGLIKYYRLTGKTKSIISLINGTNKINTHLEFDINGKIIPNESNILLKKEQNKLKVSFFEPYPDEIEICFYNDFKSEQVKNLLYNESKKLKDIHIDISSYQNNNLNLLMKRIRYINNVKTIKCIYIQLDKNEQPNYYNIDPIRL
ncbi:MAG: hypothetical protein ACK479_02985 [Fluviicola sp.]